MKCLYCEKNNLKGEELYFSCPMCGNGMCDECYEKYKGTDEQAFDIDEIYDDMEPGFYSFVLSKSGGCTRLICCECLERLDDEFRRQKKEFKMYLLTKNEFIPYELDDTIHIAVSESKEKLLEYAKRIAKDTYGRDLGDWLSFYDKDKDLEVSYDIDEIKTV